MGDCLPPSTYDVIAGDNRLSVRSLVRELGELSGHVFDASFSEATLSFFSRWIPNISASVFEFRENLQPRLIQSEGEDHDVDMVQYLSGLYLLDPYYEAFAKHRTCGVFALSADDGGDFALNDTFKHYWSSVNGTEELGVNFSLSPDRCIHLSLFLPNNEKQFVEGARAFMQLVETNIGEMLKTHFTPVALTRSEEEELRRQVHKAVSNKLHKFGAEKLTDREREIVQLLLMGHSAKSLARVLEITPGTASIHRSNIYKKLGVVGQGDLFGLFVAQLSS